MMRRALLSLAVLATTTTTTRAALRRALASTPAEGSPQDEYVRHWAHEGKSRCGAPNCRWMREFGPIDVVTRSQCDRALRNLDAFDLRPERAGRASLYETLPVAALNKSILCRRRTSSTPCWGTSAGAKRG